MSLLGKDFLSTIKPPPPPMLNKETIGVWVGWTRMGDKEVAREAAAKGSHINLVMTFLASRKKLVPEETELWFRNEVFTWINELLERKQIFRATHILNNIKIEPIEEFTNIFYTTRVTDLRNYIGNHLKSLHKLSEHLNNLWILLDLILTNSASQNLVSEIENVEILDKQTKEWKTNVATNIFLKTFDQHLKMFLRPDYFWKHLLYIGDTKLLKFWLKLNFEKNYNIAFGNYNENLVNVLKEFEISKEMLDILNSDNIQILDKTKNIVLNQLSNFGIFLNKDKENIIQILNRLLLAGRITDIFEILNRKTSTVTQEEFMKMFIDFCEKNNFHTILSCILKHHNVCENYSTQYANFFVNFCTLLNKCDEINLKNNIFTVTGFINKGSYTEFYNDNYLLLLSLLLFSKDTNFLEIVINKNSFMIDSVDLTQCFFNILDNCNNIKSICDKFCDRTSKNNLTFYDMIEKHFNLDVAKLFKFRRQNLEVSHFSSNHLESLYGYNKKVNYVFYIMQSRPSVASKFFILTHFERYSSLYEDCFDRKVEKKIFHLSVDNFNNSEITTSCVAFYEMLGKDSEILRVHIKAANSLFHSGYDEIEIKHVFRNLDKTCYEVQNNLENVLVNKINFANLCKGRDFIEVMEKYDFLIGFSIKNDIKLPELFLRHCCMHNLWLPFLIFAQINDYPLDQIKEILQCIKIPHLLEHIHHSVMHDIAIEVQSRSFKKRDAKKYFFSRIGVPNKLAVPTELHLGGASVGSHSSGGSEVSSGNSDLLEIDILNTKATLLQTLIRCHNSSDPPRAFLQACQLYRNPLLAIFATSYEPDSIVVNWLTWLSVSCELYHLFTNFESLAMNSSWVTELLNKTVRKQYINTLLESFLIFLPDNPLKIFLDFLSLSLEYQPDRQLLTQTLTDFKSGLKNLRRSSIITDADLEMTYLTNKSWIEQTSLVLLYSLLEYNCKSSYQQLTVLKLLCDINLHSYFSIECPNFQNLLIILEALYENKSNVKLNIGAMLGTTEKRETVLAVTDSLNQEKLYGTALTIAQIENLPVDLILIEEWNSNFENRVDEDMTFWTSCEDVFRKHSVTADCVTEFYSDCINKLKSNLEKYHVLKLSTQWARDFDLSTQYELEQKMWLSYVSLEDKYKASITLDRQNIDYSYRTLQETLKKVSSFKEDVQKDSLVHIERVINEALKNCDFWLALKLEKMFNRSTTDLELLKLCFKLAEGLQTPYQLNADERVLLSKGQNLRVFSGGRRTFLSNRFSSYSSSPISHSLGSPSCNYDAIDCPIQDTLALIQSLSEKLVYGNEIATKIFMRFRISINIEMSYDLIVFNPDYMSMLKNALEDDCSNKLEVVHDFIGVYKWTKSEIADFISEELVNASTYFVKSRSETLIMWDLDINQEFNLILQLLLDECSILGHKIYTYAKTLYKAQIVTNTDVKISELALVVELLIRAHDCFTADCNMEGISLILNKCQSVICHLVTLKSWKLIVRLLTGIGRYTEMSYVFQILKDNDQFEFLLRKVLKKDNGLKLAVVDYLKKHCPDNRELYKIVALHFALFSEVAQLWEREAQSIIRNLIAISKLEMQNNKINPDLQQFILFTNTDGTKICLNKAMENYTHATEFHLQGEKLAKAMNAARQAELLAMQISLLKGLSNTGTANCLLNLSSIQINSLIINDLSFHQALILTEAYNFQPDWTHILFEQCVIKGDLFYLEHFLSRLHLTDSLIHDISRKFLSADLNSDDLILNMKNIIQKLPSVHTKYKIASELGFKDVVEELITKGQLAYLKDTVWKKGYRN